jgi:hypothetical protein
MQNRERSATVVSGYEGALNITMAVNSRKEKNSKKARKITGLFIAAYNTVKLHATSTWYTDESVLT